MDVQPVVTTTLRRLRCAPSTKPEVLMPVVTDSGGVDFVIADEVNPPARWCLRRSRPVLNTRAVSAAGGASAQGRTIGIEDDQPTGSAARSMPEASGG